MLYDRDYRVLTESEIREWEKAEKLFKKSKNGVREISLEKLEKYYRLLPEAALHFKQVFPNNYLSSERLRWSEEKDQFIIGLKTLFTQKLTERTVLNFINNNKAYYIVASIVKSFHYNFGHHGIYVFREFELANNFIVDYLLIGKNSGGYEFIFIELESPEGRITNSNGEFGTVIRKGIKQINDWDKWIEVNYSSLRTTYQRYLGKQHQLPSEFFELDKTRIHYVVIAGRRNNFTNKTYQLKRKLLKENNILLLHYDNLLDSVKLMFKRGN